MSKNIGIIGSGNIGKGLAMHLSKTPYKVFITNSKGPSSLKDLVDAIGGNLVAASFEDTIAQANVLFMAAPWSQLKDIAKSFSKFKGKIIVDATNNILSVDPFVLDNMGNKTSGEYVAALFPEQHVVKAFNNMAAATLSKPPQRADGTLIIFISGDSKEAKAEVAGIVEDMGFAPVDLGEFRNGSRLQEVAGALWDIEFIKAGK